MNDKHTTNGKAYITFTSSFYQKTQLDVNFILRKLRETIS